MKTTHTQPEQKAEQKAEFRIRLLHDNNPENPFEDWECLPPTMYDSGRNGKNDFSNGGIDKYLCDYLNFNQIIRHQKKILDLLDYESLKTDVRNAENADEKVDLIYNELEDFIRESIDNKIKFCETFNILHYSGTARGYGQGDWADVFILPSTDFYNITGINPKKHKKEDLKSTFELFENWAFGDVYGFIIEQKKEFIKTYVDGSADGSMESGHDWEEVDSCFGFYGTDWEENGMLEAIQSEVQEWSKEEIKEILENAEIEY
jgi:hypothetical protein